MAIGPADIHVAAEYSSYVVKVDFVIAQIAQAFPRIPPEVPNSCE
jgi:hypothetical protein